MAVINDPKKAAMCTPNRSINNLLLITGDVSSPLEPPTPRLNSLLLAAENASQPPPLLVRNVVNTAGHSCRCGSWRNHWVRHTSSSWPPICSVLNCFGIPTDGGHVRRVSGADQSWYIIPLCSGCNKWDSDLLISPDTNLVPAKDLVSCGR